jgi:hypothetical protein
MFGNTSSMPFRTALRNRLPPVRTPMRDIPWSAAGQPKRAITSNTESVRLLRDGPKHGRHPLEECPQGRGSFRRRFDHNLAARLAPNLKL